MSVGSLIFFLFCAAVFLVYYIVPKKVQWIVLLLASIGFYCYSGVKYTVYILACSLITYLIGRKLGKIKEEQKEKLKTFENPEQKKKFKERTGKIMRSLLALGVVLVLSQLIAVKYTGFIIENINSVLTSFGKGVISVKDIVAPLGCSYYTFTMISYLADIYRGKIKPQKNYLKYLLFVSYFPQIIQGPIPRYGELSDQFFKGYKFSFPLVRDGIVRVIWGVFKKMVVAEPLGVFVATAYGDYADKSSLALFCAAVFYSIQIYADFSGYTDIVSGVSECFGINLPKNFERPFFARTIPEFWRRWHISLSSWFREYVFYALSSSKALLKLNRNARKVFGNGVGRVVSISIPVLSVWILTGFWHGASWNMICWGLFHGVLIMLSIIFEPAIEKLTKRLHIKTESFSWAVFQMLRTTFLCTVGRIISRTPDLKTAFNIIKKIFTGFSVGGITANGLSVFQLEIVAASVFIMLVVGLIQEYCCPAREWLSRQNIWLRWLLIFSLVAFIFLFGTYGINAQITFIYEQF